ncbi:MAG: hypothetical protein QXW04_01855 [Candidatus Aenigmatarchaeota archaeon]|nr:hypothetical protein [Candidatus Aenigmarchaeota archaeon]
MVLEILKINKDKEKLLFILFILFIFLIFLIDASTTKVNLCKINGNTTNQSCIVPPIQVFPYLKE